MKHACANCGSTFVVTDEDLALLHKLSPVINGRRYPFPPPSLCPDCRYRRRMAMRNERTLYRRKCDKTGEEMISLYAPDSPCTVYEQEVWFSDAWDALDYGQSFDFNQPFFEQLWQLRCSVPRRSMQQDSSTNENCEYTTYGSANRNCYLTFTCVMCQDVYHSTWLAMCRSCVDCLACFSSELLYECIDCQHCYRCLLCENSKNCQDSYLLDNCRNCHHCIACKNLRHKGYHILNRPVSEEKFAQVKATLHGGALEEKRKRFNAWRVRLPVLYARIEKSEHCTGNFLENARNCHNCFDVILGAEDLRHCQYCGWKGKDMMDCCMAGKQSEMLYEVMGGLALLRSAFSLSLHMCHDCYYCDSLKHCSHCFGCIGLQHKKYCILNKQYMEEEYFALIAQIIELMKKTREWGENVPIKHSHYPYNDTLAQERWPMTKEDALAKDYRWQDRTDAMPNVEKIIPAERLPASIKDIPDDVLNWAIRCERTRRPFRIVRQELAFYRHMNLPLPRLHPEERHQRRVGRRLPHKLWRRPCMKCGVELWTSYAPDRPELVYCESCYLDAAYGAEGAQDHVLNRQILHTVQMSAKNIARTADAAALYVRSKMRQKEHMPATAKQSSTSVT